MSVKRHTRDRHEEIPSWAAELKRAIGIVNRKVEKIMATLDEILADVTAESTRLDSIQALLDGLRQQLKDALAGVKLPPETQAKVDAIFTMTEANKAKVDAALNTGVEPPPPPAP